MALTRKTAVFAVTDAKISPMVSDEEGGTTTYGTSIDVPGIKSVTITGSIESKVLRGDNRKLASLSVLTDVNVSIEHAKFSFDVMAALLGGVVAETGTTPAQSLSWDLTADDAELLPFKLEAVSASSDVIGGNFGLVLHKVVASSFPEFGMAEEDFRTYSWEGAADPLLSNGKWVTPTLYETAHVIA